MSRANKTVQHTFTFNWDCSSWTVAHLHTQTNQLTNKLTKPLVCESVQDAEAAPQPQ